MNRCSFKITCSLMIIVACASILDKAVAIQCFSCDVTRDIVTLQNDNYITPICSQFDGSSEFIINCTYSTMCERKISTMYLQNGFEKKTITLGCAKQKSLRHVFKNGKWADVYDVNDVYQEGCKTTKDNNLFGASRTYCHCKGHLCNSAHFIYSPININILLLSILTIVNLVRM